MLVPDGWVTYSHAEFVKRCYSIGLVYEDLQNMTANAKLRTPKKLSSKVYWIKSVA